MKSRNMQQLEAFVNGLQKYVAIQQKKSFQLKSMKSERIQAQSMQWLLQKYTYKSMCVYFFFFKNGASTIKMTEKSIGEIIREIEENKYINVKQYKYIYILNRLAMKSFWVLAFSVYLIFVLIWIWNVVCRII